VARLEHPGLRIFQADMPAGSSDRDLRLLADLLCHGIREHTIALRPEGIAIPRLVRLDQGAHSTKLRIRADGGYLVTGAFGGLGLRTTKWLADRGAKELFLVGRREPSTEARQLIEKLQASGVAVHIIAADISKQQDIDKLALKISKASSQLRGILHAAGTLDDGILVHQSSERLATVFAPKVAGGWLLHKLSMQYRLDFFVMFSSAAALLGSTGQSNYAAANAFLDALAELRHHLGLPATSIAWGAWSDVGMAARLKGALRPSVTGVGSITPDGGMELQERAILSGRPTLAALTVDWNVLQTSRTAHSDWPLLQKLGGAAFNQEVQAGPASLTLLVEKAAPAERLHVIKEYLKARISTVLMLTPEDVLHEDQPFAELGLDSLMALELKNELQISSGAALPSTFLFDYPDLGSAAVYLDALMTGDSNSGSAQFDAADYEEIVL
jgi:phthiocerol/phenolphthiocerol synthesis type-I polyketide synthase D